MTDLDPLAILCLVLIAALIFAMMVLSTRHVQLRRDVDALRSELFKLAPRTGAIGHAKNHRSVPKVDAQGRTTRRDTDDLPATGRMSQGVKRVKTNARDNRDGGFPEYPGDYPA